MWQMWISKIAAQGAALRSSMYKGCRAAKYSQRELEGVSEKSQAYLEDLEGRVQERDRARNSLRWTDEVDQL